MDQTHGSKIEEISPKEKTRREIIDKLGPILIQLAGSEVPHQLSYRFLKSFDIETLETYQDLKLLKASFNLIHPRLIREDPQVEEPLSSKNLTFQDQTHFLLSLFRKFGYNTSRLKDHKQFVASIKNLGLRQHYLDNPREFFQSYLTYNSRYSKDPDEPSFLPKSSGDIVMDETQAGAAIPIDHSSSSTSSSSSSSSLQQFVPLVIPETQEPDPEQETGLYELSNIQERARLSGLLRPYAPYNDFDDNEYNLLIKTAKIEKLIERLNANLKQENPYARVLKPVVPVPAKPVEETQEQFSVESRSGSIKTQPRKKALPSPVPKTSTVDLSQTNDGSDNDEQSSVHDPSDTRSERSGLDDNEVEFDAAEQASKKLKTNSGDSKISSASKKNKVVPSASSSAGTEANKLYHQIQAKAGKGPYKSVGEYPAKNGKHAETVIPRKSTAQPPDVVDIITIDRFARQEELINGLSLIHYLEETKVHEIEPARYPCTSCRRVHGRVQDNTTNDLRTWYFCMGCSNLTEGLVYMCCPRCAMDHAFSKVKHMLLLETIREIAEFEPTAGADDGFKIKKGAVKKAPKK